MNSDREPNRLPLRAGAMVLLAVAIVFIGLGWHSAASGDDGAADDVAGPVTTAEPTEDGETSAAPATTSSAPNVPEVCVLNVGNVTGLAGQVAESLNDAGFRATADNLPNSSITENTLFYGSGERDAAEEVAAATGLSEVSVEARTSSVTQCPDGLFLAVRTR